MKWILLILLVVALAATAYLAATFCGGHHNPVC